MRDMAWAQVQARVGTPRKFYRAADGFTPLDEPTERPVSSTDWRMPDTPSPASWSSIHLLKKGLNKTLEDFERLAPKWLQTSPEP
jgi:hypothetical protein